MTKGRDEKVEQKVQEGTDREEHHNEREMR